MNADFIQRLGVGTSGGLRSALSRPYYNPVVEIDKLKILFAVEPKWLVSLNGLEFLQLESREISVARTTIRFGRYERKIKEVHWVRPNVVRIVANARARTQSDTIIFYGGDRYPSGMDLRRRRRTFQIEIGKALCAYFNVRNVQRQTLYADRRYGIGGAYPRFLVGRHAVIAVDPDETSSVINGLMRSALLWKSLVRRPLAAVVPRGRANCIVARLRAMPKLRQSIVWLEWDGQQIGPLDEFDSELQTHVHPFSVPDAQDEVNRLCAEAPGLLQPIPHIAGQAISIRLRGLEVARVSMEGTVYPLGQPLSRVIQELSGLRHYGSRHLLARTHEERWLESNVIGNICQLLPFVDVRHIYPQVPSFFGEERNIIDLLTITGDGRLVIIEIKVSADPELPFQALDYWIAVERHRKAGDFANKGYFAGCDLRDEPAMLVLVAPLLAYHKTSRMLTGFLQPELPLLQIGINQAWKKEIKILRRQGMVS
jgi:hypothetical protein